jgi:hypothetical protein
LTQAVSELRQALGDDAGAPQFIKTVARRGYRFIAPVTRIESTPPSAGARSFIRSASPEPSGCRRSLDLAWSTIPIRRTRRRLASWPVATAPRSLSAHRHFARRTSASVSPTSLRRRFRADYRSVVALQQDRR